MSFFSKLFGEKGPSGSLKGPTELVFKSNIAAYRYEYVSNPCRDPAVGSNVMGLVLHSYRDKKNVQYVHVLAAINGNETSFDMRVQACPGLDLDSMPEDLRKIAKEQGMLMPRVTCADRVPDLVQGDFVAIQIGMHMPGVKSIAATIGVVVSAPQPILHPQRGWKNRP